MNRLVIFKSAFVHSLRASVSANLLKYQRDQSWTREIGALAAREMQTEVQFTDPLTLHEPKDRSLMDVENAIRLHSTLRHLTPLQARDPRLWTHLSHVECWQYMRKRWAVERHISQRDRAARNKEVLLVGGNRDRIRRLAKFLNLHGGVSILDCLSKAEIIDLLQKEFSRIPPMKKPGSELSLENQPAEASPES